MRLPRGSVSSLLSLAAGIAAAAAVATTWLPVIRYAEQQEAAILARQLAMTASLTAQALSRPAALDDPQEAIAALPAATGIDQAAVLGPDGSVLATSGAGLSVSALATLCPPAALSEPAPVPIPPVSTDSGERLKGACAAVRSAEGELLGVTVALSGLDYEPLVERQRQQARTLLLLLGALSGLLVMFAIRLLLAPVQTISRAAARIVDGEHDVRVPERGPEELAQLARAVNSLARYLERREDEIGSRMAVVKQLASVVAHEVRNPLQSLSLLCTLARTEEDAEKRDKLLASINEEIHVLEGVVQRFLRSSGPLRISRSDVDLITIVEQAASVARPRAAKAGVSMLIQAPGSLPMHIDGSLVRRALENLMLNAIEFAGQQPPGQVTVSVLPREDHVRILVDDDGPGVPANERERIFEQYFSSKPGGTGLGLSLVRRVFDTHGGSVRCEDSPLGGARFAAAVPLSVNREAGKER